MPDIIANAKTRVVVGNYMRNAAAVAIEKVAKEALAILKENIIKYTYAYDYFPNILYEGGTRYPSFEFFEAWELRDMKKNASYVSQELFHDWESMTVDSLTYRHWSSRFGDSRKRLADILNTNGVSNWGRMDRKVRKAFWNLTIYQLINRGVLTKMFTAELGKFGFIKIR